MRLNPSVGRRNKLVRKHRTEAEEGSERRLSRSAEIGIQPVALQGRGKLYVWERFEQAFTAIKLSALENSRGSILPPIGHPARSPAEQGKNL